jgi:ElaB/YqjD/DUF883 family membrane-anchored ribosome-binding protein
MIRRLAVLTSLVVLPSLASAQRTRSQADRHTDMFDKNPGPTGIALRVRDVEDVSPLKVIIDKRKDLKLTDAQLASAKDAENKLKDKNAPLLKTLDSLIREARTQNGASTDAGRAKMQGAMSAIRSTLQDVDANYDAAAKDVVATLDADQQTKANELIAKRREEGEKTIRQKMRPAGGGGPGGASSPQG